MFLSEWREFPSAPCLVGGKKNLMRVRVSMSLKSRASLTCFRACFLPGRAKDLSVHRYFDLTQCVGVLVICVPVFTVFCIVCTVFLYCFVYVYLFLSVLSVLV